MNDYGSAGNGGGDEGMTTEPLKVDSASVESLRGLAARLSTIQKLFFGSVSLCLVACAATAAQFA